MNLFGTFFVVVTLTSVSNAYSCKQTDNCLTVICEKTTGSIHIDQCHRSSIIFNMTSSSIKEITPGFFGATNFDARVTAFNAINNRWPIIGNSAFKYFYNTVKIDLSNNGISVVRSYAFLNLIHLKHLDLSRNVIIKLEPQCFHPESNQQFIIELLDMSYNRISSLQSGLLSELRDLKELRLEGNRIDYIDEKCFINNKVMTTLKLNQNLISELNLTLSPLENLLRLDISYNNIKLLSNYEINRLAMLVYFNASHNRLEKVERNCFERAAQLHTVDVSYNYIHNPIENVMFNNTPNLTYLNYYSNNISIIENNAFKYNKLEYFNIEKNNITGGINASSFDGLDHITLLDLSSQHITALDALAFDLDSLNMLNLSKNSIDTINQMAFFSSNIKILDLSYNKMSDLRFLNNTLGYLKELYLNNNNINNISNGTFQYQTLLVKLDLSLNNIFQIEPFSLSLDNLQYINLVGNHLNGTLKPNVFNPAKLLRYLDLNKQDINVISNMSIANMPLLAKLNLSDNGINSIGFDNFVNMNNMYSLDLSFNNLCELNLNRNVSGKLKALHLKKNHFTNIKTIFRHTSNLIYLDISDNKISDMTLLHAKLLPSLSSLYLSNNDITVFNTPQTNTLVSLLDLNLSTNKISEIDLSYFDSLIEVNLSNNSFSYINATTFENSDHLSSLDLSMNQIKEIPPGTFKNTVNLKSLNLSTNHLSRIRYGCFQGLNKTQLLDLTNNMIEALDVYVFHETSSLVMLLLDNNHIKTIDVSRLVRFITPNLKSLSIGRNPIECHEVAEHAIRFSSPLREVYITSVDKIYLEDNVHGIKCGDDSKSISSTTDHPLLSGEQSTSGLAIFGYCAFTVTIVVIIIAIVIYYRFPRFMNVFRHARGSRAPISLELNSSEYPDSISNYSK